MKKVVSNLWCQHEEILHVLLSSLSLLFSIIGAPTVRLIIKIYNTIKTYVQLFLTQGGIVLADTCDITKGFECTGGILFARRRLRVNDEVSSLFGHQDRAGFPMTPIDVIQEERALGTCSSSFSPPDCDGECTCDGTIDKSICFAKLLRCRGESVDGLTFPFLSDLGSVLGLLTGGDIVSCTCYRFEPDSCNRSLLSCFCFAFCTQDLVRFIPPDVVFAFEYRLGFVVHTPPVVEVAISFEFTVRLKVGFNLDTKGIREAVEQKAPLKALNSFALIDTFNGVDEAMITATASVTLAVEVSAVIVKVGVSGSITFEVTIDLFDPFPETSRGLVRPFELLSMGSTPFEWFEFGLRIFITIR